MLSSRQRGTLHIRRLIAREDMGRRGNARAKAMPDDLPLSGVRVVDVTANWAGPHATRVLADYGAQVINIEYSKRLDMMRGWVKKFQVYNLTPAILHLNRNKLSITLDLKDPRGVDVFKELVKISDVVIECSRVGAMKKLGLDYETLKKIRPDIIFVSMPAFGYTGPEAPYVAYGGSLEALSGIQSLTAYGQGSAGKRESRSAEEPESRNPASSIQHPVSSIQHPVSSIQYPASRTGEKPVRAKELDVFNGLQGASAVMTALLYRERTGKGQWVDLSQLEASTTGLIGEHLLEYEMNGNQTLPMGNRHPTFAPHGCYRCKGNDKWVVIAVRTDAEWERFCDVVGHSEWKDDGRFRSGQDRLCNHDELDNLIETWTTQHTHYEAMYLLQEAGIAAGAVLSAAEVCSDPHVRERGFIRTARGAGEGGLRFPGVPFKFSDRAGNGDVFWRGSRLGEDNEYVLCEILNRPKADLEILEYDEVRTAFDLEDE